MLPDYSPELFQLNENKLVQHDFTDLDNNLIPAWTIEKSTLPRHRRADFSHFPLANPLPVEEPSLEESPNPPKTEVFDDFALFSSKKRKEIDLPPEDHETTKKTRTDKADVEMVE